MIDSAIFLMILGGFASLLMAMPRHSQEWLQHKLTSVASSRFRRTGFTMLILALFQSVSCLGWAYGIVTWTGWLTLAALVIVLSRSNRDHILRLVRR